ncbi:MAG TPA: nucleotidyltransferase family protein [Anaerolineae bacterium]|nr:nucleotidyltransferase family protein [Anaerolineae bacterium]
MGTSRQHEYLSDGQRIARALRGSWRVAPPSPNLTEQDLIRILPRVKESGAASLVWWSIRRTPLAKTPTGAVLRQLYMEQSVYAARSQIHVYRYVSALHTEQIEPIVFKGWALLPYYAEAGLRPVGDVDLAVAPEVAERARNTLERFNLRDWEVDVHAGLEDPVHSAYIPFLTWDDVFAHTRRVPIGDRQVRCLAPEDELQLLCIHFMRHRGFRPVWLCDIAAALEARPANFDWARALSKPPYTSWITYTLRLAEQLFDVNLGDTPLSANKFTLPEWLVRGVLERWGEPTKPQNVIYDSVFQLWRNPSRWAEAWRVRVHDRFSAAIECCGSLDEPFLMRYQLFLMARTLTDFARRNVTSNAE